MKRIFFIILLLVSSLSFFGQDLNKLEYKNGFGFSLGPSVGYGFTYKSLLTERLYAQFTVLPPIFYFHSQPDSATRSGVNIFSSGLMFSYGFYQTNKLREYAYAGAFYHYLSGNFFDNGDYEIIDGKGCNIVGGGFGLGIEFFTDCVGLNFYLGESYSQKKWEKRPYNDEQFYPDFKGGISLGGSVIYYFK